MSTIELKQKLISKIQETVDDSLLEEALRLLNSESSESEVLVLNKDQVNAVNEAQAQIKSGQFLSNEQANKEIDEWLNK
ncbi:MAG: hypothetical protein WA958_20835 [Tunicatimonas sp.]